MNKSLSAKKITPAAQKTVNKQTVKKDNNWFIVRK